MPRPKTSRRSLGNPFSAPNHSDKWEVPPLIRELLDAPERDPALPLIELDILRRRLLGDDVMDAVVLAECIAAGRRAYADKQLGETA